MLKTIHMESTMAVEKSLGTTRFPDTTTPRPKNKGRPPNIVIIPRSEDGHDAGPKDGSQYFGIHKPCTISMTAGKA